jgi:hypothetical protein
VAKTYRITTGIGARKAIELAVRLQPNVWNRLSAGKERKANAGTTGPSSDHRPRRRPNRAPRAPDPPQPQERRVRLLPGLDPEPVPIRTLVKIAGRRWTIEESFAASKELAALDEHQVRTWTS